MLHLQDIIINTNRSDILHVNINLPVKATWHTSMSKLYRIREITVAEY